MVMSHPFVKTLTDLFPFYELNLGIGLVFLIMVPNKMHDHKQSNLYML